MSEMVEDNLGPVCSKRRTREWTADYNTGKSSSAVPLLPILRQEHVLLHKTRDGSKLNVCFGAPYVMEFTAYSAIVDIIYSEQIIL